MENISNIMIGDTFYSPVTKKTYKAYPAADVCKGCAFRELSECCYPETMLGVEGFQCVAKIYKEEMKTSFKDFWKPGNIIILDNNKCYYCTSDDYAVGLKESICITYFNETGKGCEKSISQIVSHPEYSYGLGFEYNLKPENAIEEVLWSSKNNIKEMTISEIEEKLGMISGSLRVKKEND